MATLKYYIKEVTGGQLLNRKERAIFLWWSLSLCFTLILAESIPLLIIAVANFAISSRFLEKIPISKFPLPDDEWEDEEI